MVQCEISKIPVVEPLKCPPLIHPYPSHDHSEPRIFGHLLAATQSLHLFGDLRCARVQSLLAKWPLIASMTHKSWRDDHVPLASAGTPWLSRRDAPPGLVHLCPGNLCF